jgi:preprotein translocase subunit YajC
VNLWPFRSEALVLLAQQAAPNAPFWQQLLASPILIMVVIFVLFFVMVSGPERRKRKELQDQLQRLKKNDEVVTIGGICGTVANVQQGSDRVTLRIDEATGAKITVLRSAIQRVVTAEDKDPLKKDVKSDA